MSGPVRAGVVFGLAAVAAVVGAQLLSLAVSIPCIGFLSVVALGLGAGYTAAKTTNATREQRIGRGATAGAIAGTIALIGGALGVYLVTFLPAYQQQIAAVTQQLQQDPNFQDSGLDPAQLNNLIAGAGGIIGGVCGGIINFIVMLLCGLLGSLFWKGAPTTATYVPAGGSYIPGQPGDTPYSGQSYTPPADQGGARVYDPNDPNRPQ